MDGLRGLSEISQTERQILYHLYVKSKKYNTLANITENKQMHGYREQTSVYQWGEESWEGQYRSRGEGVQTIRYKISYKYILYNTGI